MGNTRGFEAAGGFELDRRVDVVKQALAAAPHQGRHWRVDFFWQASAPELLRGLGTAHCALSAIEYKRKGTTV